MEIATTTVIKSFAVWHFVFLKTWKDKVHSQRLFLFMLLSLEATDQLFSLQPDSDHWPAGLVSMSESPSLSLMSLIRDVCLRRAHSCSSTTPKHPVAEIYNASLKQRLANCTPINQNSQTNEWSDMCKIYWITVLIYLLSILLSPLWCNFEGHAMAFI